MLSQIISDFFLEESQTIAMKKQTMYFMYFSLGLSFAICFIHCPVQEGHVPSVSGHTLGYAISLLIVCDIISVQSLIFFQHIETSMKYRHLKLISG